MDEKDNKNILNEVVKVIDEEEDYSLTIDPKNQYDFSSKTKKFIEYYVEYKNMALVEVMMGLEKGEAFELYDHWSVKQEIKRLNRAHYMHIMKKQYLSLNNLQSWASAVITGDDVIGVEKNASLSEKIKLAHLILEIENAKNLKNESVIDITEYNNEMNDILKELPNLSVDEIKNRIEKRKDDDYKKGVIDKLKNSGLINPEELAFIKTLSKKELDKLLNFENDESSKSTIASHSSTKEKPSKSKPKNKSKKENLKEVIIEIKEKDKKDKKSIKLPKPQDDYKTKSIEPPVPKEQEESKEQTIQPASQPSPQSSAQSNNSKEPVLVRNHKPQNIIDIITNTKHKNIK